VSYGEGEVALLINRTSHEAAAARKAGDIATYEEKKALLEVLYRVYRGFGTALDDLEIERAIQSPLQQIAKAGKWVAIGAGALLLLPYLTKLRR
jgi:hypothetical protein